jgi:outer membrane protein assembly factor BamD (BamD/ComL family)
MRKIFLSILIFLPIILVGQISKGFDALKIYDFYKAKNIFLKSIKSNPTESNFGLAQIYYDSLNHFHHLDSAFVYISRAKETFNFVTPKKKIKIESLGINLLTINQLQNKIYSSGFIRAEKINSEYSWNLYLKNFSGSPLLQEAINNRNEAAFQLAVFSNSIDSIQTFIQKHPDADQIKKAKEIEDDLIYNQCSIKNKLVGFEKFLESYPNSRHKHDAEDAIYKLVVTENTVNQLYNFVKSFPSNRNTINAWEQLYQLYTSDQRVESFTEFKEKFPEYPFQDKVFRDAILSKTRLFPAIENEKWGYVDSTGKLIITYQFEEAENFSENLAAVKIDSLFGYINKTGLIVINPQFNEAEKFINGLAVVESTNSIGLIDQKGSWVIKYDSANISGPFNNFYIVELNENYFFLNRKGRRISNENFEFLDAFHQNLAVFKKNGKVGYLDTLCNVVIQHIYEEGTDFKNDFAQVKQNDLTGLIDTTGKLILPVKFEFIGRTNQQLIKVILNGKCGYFDKSGKNKIPLNDYCAASVLNVDGFNESLARIDKKSKKGFIDLNGKIVIPAIYDEALYYSEGLIAVRKKNKWGFIQKNGKVTIDFQFQNLTPFEQGLAKAKKNNNWGIINKDGNVILDFAYQQIQNYNDIAIVTKNDLKGLFELNSNKSEKLTEIIFDEIIISEQFDIFELIKNGKLALYHARKKTIFWKENGW